jgi:hypothetical protein
MFSGSGRYSVTYKEDGTATLTFHSGGEATVAGVTVDDEGEGSFPMTPVECPEKKGALNERLRALSNNADPSVCKATAPKVCAPG